MRGCQARPFFLQEKVASVGAQATELKTLTKFLDYVWSGR